MPQPQALRKPDEGGNEWLDFFLVCVAARV
jgi:hypothetical protein